MRRVSERFHRDEGVLYLYGPGVRRLRLDQPTQLDVAPTVLALAGLPPARDLPGRVLAEALRRAPGTAVASYEGGATPTTGGRDAQVDREIVERLRSLGYLGGAPAPPPAGGDRPAVRSPQGERNLAALHFEAGRHAEAAAAYERLVAQDPRDASLRTSLAGALGALGRYDEAMQQLEVAVKLEPLNVEAYHNRAVIFERRGDRRAAIELYRTAVRYDPHYEPSRAALLRLTGSADVRAPRGQAESRAAALAEEAAQAARRGDYPTALRRLAEAEGLAPSYVIVHQYRANVAYLMGDRAGAARALEKALRLEPDNALFRANLARLRAEAGSPSPRGR
jgi:tetratricopeptide (TPR) repeat protein